MNAMMKKAFFHPISSGGQDALVIHGFEGSLDNGCLSICVDLFAHKRVRNYGQVQRYRIRNAHQPIVSKDEWADAKNRITLPEREVVVCEEPAGPGELSKYYPIHFKEDIDL